MRHVFLSPHFDDAVGSSGGTISRLCRAGEDVVVHTIFAGRPSPPYSAFARCLHAEWRAGDSPVDARRLEDARACRLLGCRPEYSGWLDAIYRRRSAAGAVRSGPSAQLANPRHRLVASEESRPGDWLYRDHAALFGDVARDDRGLPAAIALEVLTSIDTEDALALGVCMKTSTSATAQCSKASRFSTTDKDLNRKNQGLGVLPERQSLSAQRGGGAAQERMTRFHRGSLAGVRFYAPLGVGHHVDHVLAFRAGLELRARGAQVTFYQDFFYTDWDCPHLAGLRRRARAAPFSAADFARKLRAFRCYRSQIPTLFGSAARAARYFAEANRSALRGSPYREVFWRVTR